MCETRFFNNPKKHARDSENKENSSLLFQEHYYEPLHDTLDIAHERKLYSKGTKRETIIIDRDHIDNEPTVIEFFNDLQTSLEFTPPYDDNTPLELADKTHETKSAKSTLSKQSFELLHDLTHFVHHQFDRTQEDEEKDDIAAVIKQYHEEQKMAPVSKNESNVPLTHFLKSRKGLCRHLAPFTACLLTKVLTLTESGDKGSVFCFTANIKLSDEKSSSRHIVVLYFDERGHLNLVDSSHRVCIDLTDVYSKDTHIQEAIFSKCYPKFNARDFLTKIDQWRTKILTAVTSEFSPKKRKVN